MMMPPKCIVSLPASRGRFESFASGSPFLAQSGQPEMSAYLSTFGAKRTCIVVWPGPSQSLMTQSGHRRRRSGSAGRAPDTFLLRMRPPRRLGHQLHLLAHHQRSKLRSEPLDEILVREHGRPVRAPVAVILEFPDVHELIDHPRVGDEIPDEVLVVATLLQRRKPELGIELLRLSHFANVERVGTHFVERHRISPLFAVMPVRRRQTPAVLGW